MGESWDLHPPTRRGLDGVDDDADADVALAGEAGGVGQHEGDGSGDGVDGGDSRGRGRADSERGGLEQDSGLGYDEAVGREAVDEGGVGDEDRFAGTDAGEGGRERD